MPTAPRHGLRRLLLLAMLTSIVVPALGLGSLLIWLNQQRIVVEESQAKAGKYAELLEAGLNPLLWSLDKQSAERYLATASIDEAVLDIEVRTEAGQPFVSYHRAAPPPAASDIVLSQPLRSDGRSIGVLTLRYSTQPASALAARHAWQLAGIIALQILISLAALSWFIHRRLLRPIAALDASAAAIGRGDLQTPIAQGHEDEFGALAARLEQMRQALAQAFAEQEQSRHGLQQALERESALLAGIEGFIQRLIDVIPGPVYVRKPDGFYMLVNRAFAAERGKTIAEIVGSSAWEAAHTGHLVRQEDERVLAGEQIYREEDRPNLETGEERHRIIVKEACADAEGRQVIIGANFDITELRVAQRKLEQALRNETSLRLRTQAFTQRLLDVLPDPVYVKDTQSRFLIVNRAFAEERGMPQAELIGKSSMDIAPNDEFRALLASEDREVLAGGELNKEQHTSHPLSGAEVFRHVAKRLSSDVDGKPVIIGAHFDLTRWKVAERQLAASLEREMAQRMRVQQFMQQVIDVIPQSVYVKDAQSRFVMVNHAIARGNGTTREAMVGRSPREMGYDAGRAERILAEDARVLHGEMIYREEHLPATDQGGEAFYIVSKGSCRDTEGQPVIVGANFDITDLRLAERAAEQASRAKSMFLANMSHEIRTPLGGVIGLLRIVLRNPALAQDTRDQLVLGLHNAEALLAIVNDVLDYSKIEAGHLALEAIDFELADTLHAFLPLFSQQAQARQLRLDLYIDPALSPVRKGDPARLRQVLANLCGNAIKFTERGGISVRVEPDHSYPDGSHVCFSITDTGIGIPPDVLPRLFGKFQQADSSTTRKYGGTGLGLAISKQLVELMGGIISVRSTPDVGTCFSFSIPLPPGQLRTASAEPARLQHPRALHILCAEDNPTNQLIVRSLLESMGHRVHMVDDGRAALAALAGNDAFDLVLMDGRMPEMDGRETVAHIRRGGLPGQRITNPQIPVIALTADAGEEDRLAYLAAGMNDFLSKPIDEHRLFEAITRVCIALEPVPPRPGLPRLSGRIRQTLLAKLGESLTAIDDALAARDYAQLLHHFHGIKGSIGYTGNSELAEPADRLQQAASAGELAVLEAQWPQLRRNIRDLLDSLQD